MNSPQQSSPPAIVHHLLKNDPFSRWMGIKVLKAEEGYCKISCELRQEMHNGFRVAHGGIVFSLADTALAFSAATFGRVSLAIDNSISITKKSTAGDVLYAEAKAVNMTHKTGVFEVFVKNKSGEIIAFMKGTVYRTEEEIIIRYD